MSKDASYWNKFYADDAVDIHYPSQFAAFVRSEINRDSTIIEFGCGNARDAAFFAKQGCQVVAVDSSSEVIANNQTNNVFGDRLTYLCFDPCTQSSWEHIFSREEKVIVYTRFFIHALTNAQIEVFLGNLSKSINAQSEVFFEFRTSKDQDRAKEFVGHYRNYIDLEWLHSVLAEYNFIVHYQVEGVGFAKYGNDDAYVCRMKFGLNPDQQ